MKSSILLLISLAAIISVSTAQQEVVNKGKTCETSEECKPGELPCVDGACGCKIGHVPEYESHTEGTGVYSCRKVVGYGCSRDNECSNHLLNAKCDSGRCVCNQVDHCTDDAVTVTVMSLTTLMGITAGLLKLW